MLENSTPRVVRGYLGADPQVKVASNGNSYVDLSISVSHYAGKGADGKSQYKTEWVEARAFNNEHDKTADIIAASYKKGTPVLAMLNQGFREDANLFYKDKAGQLQAFKNPVQRPDYTVEAIGIWAKAKREGGAAQQSPTQAQQAPAAQAPADVASDVF